MAMEQRSENNDLFQEALEFAEQVKTASPELHDLLKERVGQNTESSQTASPSTLRLAPMFTTSDLGELEASTAQNKNRTLTIARLSRNSGIFLPVLFTWFAIWDATKHYKEIIASPTNTLIDQSFLRIWQGSEFRGWFDLSETALIASLMLVGLIGLNILVTILETHESRQQEILGIKSKILLHRLDDATHGTDIEHTNEALADFAQASVALSRNLTIGRNDLDERLEILGHSISTINQVLEQIGERMEGQADQLALVTEALHEVTKMGDDFRALTNSAAALSELIEPTARNLKASTDAASDSHKSIADTLDNARLELLGPTAESMADLSEKLHSTYMAVTEEFTSAQSSMNTNIEETTKRLALVASNLEQTMMAMEGISEKINDAARDAHFIATEYLDLKQD